jgi:hypothetical protein
MAKRNHSFLSWLDSEIARRGRQREVAALIKKIIKDEKAVGRASLPVVEARGASRAFDFSTSRARGAPS